MGDIAELTGSTLFTPEMGVNIGSAKLEHLGTVTKITVSQMSTMFTTELAGARKEAVDKLIAKLRADLEATDAGYDREKIQERLSKLVGGVAIIKVGGATETETKEKKYRVEDAMHATRAAVAEGIVPGGGVALLRASKELREQPYLAGWTESLRDGWRIMQRALESPFRQILINAGLGPDMFVAKVLGSNPSADYGYDVSRDLTPGDEPVDLVAAGIIDPAKVVKQVLVNAASIAGLLLTTEAVVSEIEQETDELTPRQQATLKAGMDRVKNRARRIK